MQSVTTHRDPGDDAHPGRPQQGAPGSDGGRSARKRRAIIDAATDLFLRNGYQGTSMDEIAARAAVSKQTVYKNFADKQQLFADIVLGVADNSDHIVAEMTAILDGADLDGPGGVEQVLGDVARCYLAAVLRPQVLRLRRLVIAEAGRFPDLARNYYERAPARGIDVLAAALGQYAEAGVLHLPDPNLAAAHFAYLVLAIPQDKALFCPEEACSQAERDKITESAVRVFLAAYAPPRDGT